MIYVHMTHAFPHSYLVGQGTYPQNHGTTLPLILPSEVAHKYHIAWKKTTSLGAASIMLLFYFGLVLLNMLSQIWVKKGQTSAWCPLQEQLSRGLTSDSVRVFLYENRKLDNRN